ncbi:MAG: RcpC/CpaB family pilus assembly protein [Acidimicrobiia bacterium]|nr:RcpC/CpaB family pilus assembly protein [Acidimicrobiia bacterium]
MKRKIGFAVAGIMATFGALLVFLYLKDNRNASEAAPPTPEVVVEESEELLPLEQEPLAAPDPIVEGALTAIDAEGFIVNLGDPIEVPPDYLTVTFGLTSERALGGRVRPGDTVAIVSSFVTEPEEVAGENATSTDVLLHKALVADVQVEDTFIAATNSNGIAIEVAEGSLNPTNSLTYYVTIALPASQVERLVYALEFSNIWLAYQPAEAGENTNGVTTQESIHQEVSIFIDRDDLEALDEEAPEDLAFETEGEG